MNKFEDQYYKQTRNEMEGYQKERIFVDVETAVEAIKETAIELNDKEYVGFTRDMAEQIKKAYELKERSKHEREER